MNWFLIKGVLFIVIGVFLLFYILNKPISKSKPWDLKGIVGGVISILFGMYIIFESLTN